MKKRENKSNSRSEFLFNEKILNSKRSNSHLHFNINHRLLKCKRSQSEIVSSVLLILLVIIGTMLIFAFVVPFVKEKLSSGDCLNVAGKIEISSGYTCYNDDPTNKKMQVQVHILNIRSLIDGFSIELGGASTDNYRIDSTTLSGITGVSMCNGSTTLEIPPADNTERTYVITAAKPDVVRVYPILKGGKACEASDTITEIEDCSPLQLC